MNIETPQKNHSKPTPQAQNEAPKDAVKNTVKPPVTYGETDLSYNEYLKIPDLLKLQMPLSKPPHPDEMLFIIIHQSYELWFKLMIQESERSIGFLDRGEPLLAKKCLQRVGAILQKLIPQIHLLETMTPVDFLYFRDHLKPASGFQSLQYRELEFLLGLKEPAYLRFFANDPVVLNKLKGRLEERCLRDAFIDFLVKVKILVNPNPTKETLMEALRPVYQSPMDFQILYQLCECLVDLDENLGLWRDHHVRVVERIIGSKQGTGGSSGVDYLRTTLSKKCFPELWEVRTLLV